MIIRPDLLDQRSPDGIEVFQLTDDPEVPCSHVYMEAQIFAPDSSWFLLHRAAHPHGAAFDPDDPNHQYLRCDLHESCRLTPLITERRATGPSVTPDGSTIYYFIDDTTVNGGSLTLKKVRPDGTERETVMVLDSPLKETGTQPTALYPLSSISSDGERLAMPAFLGDGVDSMINGVMVFNLKNASVHTVVLPEDWINIHPQYTRSPDPDESHLLMIQHNHGGTRKSDGTIDRLTQAPGADIHAIRDDDPDAWWTFPWGRDGVERCQGHQCWRGRSADWAITSTVNSQKGEELIEGAKIASADHLGNQTPTGTRNVLSRESRAPGFYHFATDIAGTKLITDSTHGGGAVYLADLGGPGTDSLQNFTYLLDARSHLRNEGRNAHPHPFLSPDGKHGFFNSIESGVNQAYMIKFP